MGRLDDTRILPQEWKSGVHGGAEGAHSDERKISADISTDVPALVPLIEW